MSLPSSQAKATNVRDVTVLDVLQAIVREAHDPRVQMFGYRLASLDTTKHQRRDRHGGPSVAGSLYTGRKEKGKWLNKVDYLEGFRRYEGLEATRDGLRVNAVAPLSSQPVAREFLGPKQGSES
ncbi:hypothetical protein B0H13DRAFT_1902111 [Mycena leptocephala]|nr:hypothetical protein B0H13DRAFT_1902111 [Mycena leptocephala]